MTDLKKISLEEKNAIASLKKWSYLLKYGRMGKPKFCPFQISKDEKTIIWCVKKEEKQLPLSRVSRIMPGQRTAVFQRYPQPEKEYQSFSLLYGNRSLDVICKDKGEGEIWFVALQALISKNKCQISLDGSSSNTPKKSRSITPYSSSNIVSEDSGKNETSLVPIKSNKNLGRAFSDLLMYTEPGKCSPKNKYILKTYGSKFSRLHDDHYSSSPADSDPVSSSMQSSIDDLHVVFIWGEGTGDGLLGGGVHRIGNSNSTKRDSLLPKALNPDKSFDARKVSCGSKHAVVVTEQGEAYSWGEGSGGRLGHGVEDDVSTPKLIIDISRSNIQSVSCGENHICAVTQSGDLYTWGDGINSSVSHWIPKKVSGQIDGMHISFVSCGPWHSAAITSDGQLFTFGDGTFGALGHGNTNSTCHPKPVEALNRLRTVGVSCGVWHTAAIVDVDLEPLTSHNSFSRKLFTWGNGDYGQLGHGDKNPRLSPLCVVLLYDKNFSQVACGDGMTVALATSGHVYTMGGENNCNKSNYNVPLCIEDIEEISCGSHHVAVLTSKSEVFTWGKGGKGQLGHGDNKDRNIPTLIEALSEPQVKSVVCGYNVTVAICVRKQVRTPDLPMCTSCHAQFNLERKRQNCFNCGLAFCKPCTNRKSIKASLAPNTDKTYRVCEDCYHKLHKDETDTKTNDLPPKTTKANSNRRSGPDGDHRSPSLFSRLSSFDSFKLSGSVSTSRATSPVSFKSSPNHSTNLVLPEAEVDDSKRKDDNVIKDVSILREQVIS
uniref:PH, RCC1 and FYVE domains-containing protein 1-like n=1 Tax=Erigeron canadensis TaxID=72917 RepID=UPI001CB9430D|nr:PH, RCC1 and FYVE domains-containing protein 1-like [Erigeron canadensis]